MAAQHGNLTTLKWAGANGCPWNKGTMHAAATGMHLEVVKWALDNGCPQDAQVLRAVKKALDEGDEEGLARAFGKTLAKERTWTSAEL